MDLFGSKNELSRSEQKIDYRDDVFVKIKTFLAVNSYRTQFRTSFPFFLDN